MLPVSTWSLAFSRASRGFAFLLATNDVFVVLIGRFDEFQLQHSTKEPSIARNLPPYLRRRGRK